MLIVLALRAAGYLRNTITMEHLHDVAKLMFGFTVFWAYIAFAQYFLIWYGNMPEETQFYLLRRNGSVVSGFDPAADPVFRRAVLHAPAAGAQAEPAMARGHRAPWILVMHAYDLYWQMMPVLHQDTIHFHWHGRGRPGLPVRCGAVVSAIGASSDCR